MSEPLIIESTLFLSEISTNRELYLRKCVPSPSAKPVRIRSTLCHLSFYLGLAFGLINFTGFAQTSGVELGNLLSCRALILVRHADVLIGGDKKHLLPEGTNRAIELANVLENSEISKVFISGESRTWETIQFFCRDQAAKGHNIQVLTNLDYHWSDPKQLIAAVQKDIKTNDVILIVYHSHLIPQIVSDLSDSNPKANVIEDSTFDKMFIFIPDAAEKKMRLIRTKYGKVTP